MHVLCSTGIIVVARIPRSKLTHFLTCIFQHLKTSLCFLDGKDEAGFGCVKAKPTAVVALSGEVIIDTEG